MLEAGFAIERVQEPTADDEVVRRYPDLADTRIGAYFPHPRAGKEKN